MVRAATTVQRMSRGQAARATVAQMHATRAAAATTIQSIARGNAARAVVASMRVPPLTEAQHERARRQAERERRDRLHAIAYVRRERIRLGGGDEIRRASGDMHRGPARAWLGVR